MGQCGPREVLTGARMEPTIYKPSIYKGDGIYKTVAEGGGGGGVNGFKDYYLRPTVVENNNQTIIVDNDKLYQKQSNGSMFGMGSTNFEETFSDINKLEVSLHATIREKYPTKSHGETWLMCGDYNPNTDSFTYATFSIFIRKNSNDNFLRTGFGVSYINRIDNPNIYGNESIIKFIFDRAERKVYTVINGTVYNNDISLSDVSASQKIYVGYGVKSYDQAFINNSIIYSKGTYIKLNECLVWGEEE